MVILKSNQDREESIHPVGMYSQGGEKIPIGAFDTNNLETFSEI
jgi:hypothetical protein